MLYKLQCTALRVLTLKVGHGATLGNRDRRFTLDMTVANEHERILNCPASE